MKNIVRKKRTIEVPYESLLYLHEVMHKERCEREYKPLSDKYKERLRRSMPKDGLYVLGDGDLGGCNGDPHDAWAQGRWTSWSIETMMAILEDAGLAYGNTGVKEVIDVYF